MNISALEGKTILDVYRDYTHDNNDRIVFETDDGRFAMTHYQDCCENVTIHTISGDLQDLVGEVVRLADERTRGPIDRGDDHSETWTFYAICTMSTDVTISWYGTSNGYYSESVDFFRLED